MSTDLTLVPASPEQCAAAAAFQRAAADYFQIMLPSIAPKRREAMLKVLDQGGWVDAVARVDGAMLTRIPIELVSPDGTREELCHAYTPDVPAL